MRPRPRARARRSNRDRRAPPSAKLRRRLHLRSCIRSLGTWMRHADQALADEALLLIIQQELAKRHKKSKTRGRPGTTAEVVLRMMLLKHFRDWSFEDLTREVRANLVYREFTRIGGGKVPDDKTMGRLARQLGPAAVEQLHRRVVEIAVEKRVVTGRKLRVDTTVVETNIHYPTDSSLLGDGVRALTRVMKKVGEISGPVGTLLRNRTRSIKLKVLAIARASRNQTESGKQKMKQAYVSLLDATGRVVGQAQKFSQRSPAASSAATVNYSERRSASWTK